MNPNQGLCMALFLLFRGFFLAKTLFTAHFSGHEVSDTTPILLPKLVLEAEETTLN